MPTSKDEHTWEHLQWFVGFDWGCKTHQLVVLDAEGHRKTAVKFEHDADGWSRTRQTFQQLAGTNFAAIGVAVETCVGPVVEMLMELGCTVYPMNPKAASRYRDRKAPSGTKDDILDAWSFADALRCDGRHWRVLQPEDPMTQQIRLLCRDEVHLTERRTACVNELRYALREYYPAALEAFSEWTSPAAWAFIKRFPTPQKLVRACKQDWDKFLHAHKLYRPQTYQQRIECFRHATDLCGSDAVTQAKSLLALSLVAQLQTIEKQLAIYRAQIKSIFDQHPKRDIFDSLPGAAEKLAPRLLAECAVTRQRFDNAEGFECYAGVAPIRFQSGQMSITKIRRACCKPLRYAVHLWANTSRQQSNWANVYYKQKRKQGKTHACALRCLGKRWLRIVWKMLETGQPYDEAYHLHNQIKHGSWVLQPNP